MLQGMKTKWCPRTTKFVYCQGEPLTNLNSEVTLEGHAGSIEEIGSRGQEGRQGDNLEGCVRTEATDNSPG